MMYAATKATVKKAFQSGVVVDDIAATSKVNTLNSSWNSLTPEYVSSISRRDSHRVSKCPRQFLRTSRRKITRGKVLINWK